MGARALAACTVAVCVLAAPAGAFGYCRAVTINAPSGFDPSQAGVCFPWPGTTADLSDAGCGAVTEPSGIFDQFWASSCVGYSLQQSASARFPLEQATQLARQAFDTWQNAACDETQRPSIQAIDNGPVDCDQVRYNSDAPNQHVILFHDDVWPGTDPVNTLGLTTLIVDRCTGELYDADIEINSTPGINLVATPADVPPGEAQGTYDLLSILTHEAGHFLGLAHSTDRRAVMYAFYDSGAADLSPDDVAGICDVYLANGLRATTRGAVAATDCNNGTPRHGFSTQCDAPPLEDASAPMLPPPATAAASACAMQGGAGEGRGPWAGASALVMAASALLAGRRRRKVVAAALGATMAVLPGLAHASVSIAILFDELVERADGVAIVTPVEQRSARESGRIFTYTRVHVVVNAAGALPAELWIRTLGGSVGTLSEIVEGEPSFSNGIESLVFLQVHVDATTPLPSQLFDVAARAQGQFPVTAGPDHERRLARVLDGSALLAPSAARRERAARGHPLGDPPRLASDMLVGARVDDALRDVTTVWSRAHPAQ